VNAAQIDAGAAALRERLQRSQVKNMRHWSEIPNSTKKKWRDYASIVIAAAEQAK
jgi:hypothetical protein